MPEPARIGSYRASDVSMLLTDLTRENQIRQVADNGGFEHCPARPDDGRLGQEYQPSPEYRMAVRELIVRSAGSVALLGAVLAERILAVRPTGLVIVSIARAGTPAGVIMKRWIQYRYGITTPHFSLSVLPGQGLDPNAIEWLCRRYDPATIQFVDAWTSKGTLATILNSSRASLQIPGLDGSLAVLADPASSTDLCASRNDVLFPHACLGALMSGLLGPTFYVNGLIGQDDFHGIMCHEDGLDNDLSNIYLDTVCSYFPRIRGRVQQAVRTISAAPPPDYRGIREAKIIASRYGASNLDLVNMGVSESSRGLLRRMPKVLLVNPGHTSKLDQLLRLAAERGVPVVRDASISFGAVLL